MSFNDKIESITVRLKASGCIFNRGFLVQLKVENSANEVCTVCTVIDYSRTVSENNQKRSVGYSRNGWTCAVCTSKEALNQCLFSLTGLNLSVSCGG